MARSRMHWLGWTVLVLGACDPGSTETGSTETGPTGTGSPLAPVGGSCEDSGLPFEVPDEPDLGDVGGGGGGETGGGEDTGDPVGDDIPIATAYQIRNDAVPAGLHVRVYNLVVIAPAVRLPDGRHVAFAQASPGGDYAGLPLRFADSGIVGALSVGDVLSVKGRISQRYGLRALDVDFGDASYEITSSGATPMVHETTARELAEDPARALALEGTLVRLEQAAVKDADKCSGEVEVDGGVRVDDLYVELPETSGGTLGAVTGPLRYTYNGFAVSPRTAADIEP